MNPSRLADVLYHSTLFTQTLANEVAGLFTPKKIAKNRYQLLADEHCNEYFFLEQGLMRAYATDTAGHSVTTNLYTAGSFVFEVSSFFNRTKSKENIQAITDCEGCYIAYTQLNTLFHSLPEFREFGRSILVKGYAGLKTRMLSMITETAEERYLALLKTNPEVFQQFPLKHIASYLGITDTSLSRIRKTFSKKT